MREHEVPTHVQAEDRVLLGFTFPQIVAVVAVCAISYGAYRYAPVGPSEVRMAIAALFGLVGIAMVAGKIGGRRLPLVAADLLKYRLEARFYAGSVWQLVRAEPPAPPQPDGNGPGPLKLMARRSKRVLRNLRSKKKNRQRDRRNGRMPFRPHGWFGKRRKNGRHQQGAGHSAGTLESARGRPGRGLAAVAALLVAAVALVPQAALADGPDDPERWRDEIDFELTEPVEGRRIFVDGLSVSDDHSWVTLRAATDLDIRVRAFGGPDGNALRFWGAASVHQGEFISYRIPLDGPAPAFTVSWEDDLGQAGAVTVDDEMIPYPLPEAEDEICSVRLRYLEWTPKVMSHGGVIHAIVSSECATVLPEPVEVQTVAGHADVTQTVLADAEVTAITGTIVAAAGPWRKSVPFVPGVETNVLIDVPLGEALHAVTVDVSFEATLRIPMPPLVELTHHPERTERHTETVSLLRPEAYERVSQTVTVTNDDGTTSDRTVTATAHVPAETVYRDISMTVVHPEHVRAEVVERSPIAGSREGRLSLAAVLGSDAPYEALALPEPPPEDPPAEQEPAGGLRGWFDQLGWEWPW